MIERKFIDEQLAAANLDDIMDRTLMGEEFVVTRHGTPLALMLPPTELGKGSAIIDRATIA